MKHILLCTLFLSVAIAAGSAQVGNEWINYGQDYYKFKIAEDGVYRISQSTLANAGLSDITGTEVRLYRLGQEVPVYVSTNGILGPSDYIEFYGEKNRGAFDTPMYGSVEDQLNPYFSLITDTAVYFLALSDAGLGARYNTIENELSDLPDAETHYRHIDKHLYTTHHFNPRLQPSTPVSYSHLTPAEGFTSNEQKNHAIDITSSEVYVDGDSAEFTLKFIAANLVSHDVSVVFNTDSIYTEAMSGTNVRTITCKHAADAVKASMPLTVDDVSEVGRVRLAYLNWEYPRNFTFGGESLVRFSHAGNQVRQYFELNGFNSNGEDPVVYDLKENVRLEAMVEGGLVKLVLPATTETRDIVVSSTSVEVSALEAVSFTDWSDDNKQFIIISSDRLRTGADDVQEYLDYRNSPAGGAFSTAYYSVEDIYDQFGYGLQRHPQAFRNFAQFLAANWPDAEMIFLVGKGIEYTLSRNCDAGCQAWFFVPTYGAPGADNLLFTLPGENLPVVPVGRIPVINQDEIAVYLDKVKEHDLVPSAPQTIEGKAWTKNVLHLGGGTDSDQQGQIRSLLDDMAAIIEASEFGGEVTTYTKSSTNATGESNSDLILRLLEEGVSIVKFFGHSSASTLDFQINNPREWNNKGKYPVFSAMGCSAGQIHRNFRSLSEIFVFEPDAGAIAFVAGSGSQYLNALGEWGADWYDYFGDLFVTAPLGESLKEGSRPLAALGNFTTRVLVEQQTLTGDPAVRFYPAQGRDYTWDFRNTRISPDILTTSIDTFELEAHLVNLGTNKADLVEVLVEQELPDGTRITIGEYAHFVDRNRQVLTYKIPVDDRANGANRIFLTIDQNNLIEELPGPDAELNNQLVDDNGVQGIGVFILDNRALATYPPEFAIVTEPGVDLIASSTNAFVKSSGFIIEMDTTAEFNSPALVRNNFSQFGGVLKWRIPESLVENTVYYWRVSQDSIDLNQGYVWDASSFLYAPGSDDGWNQSHYYQFLRNDYDGLGLADNRRFQFTDNVRNIWIQNAVRTGSVETALGFINNTVVPQFFRPWSNTEGNVFVMVVDSVTSKPAFQNPPGGQYGAINPLDKKSRVFPFPTKTPEDRDSLMTFLEDVIPSGQFVVLYTYQRYNEMDYLPEEWAADSVQFGRNLFSVIEAQHPESEIRSLVESGSVPYTIFYRKDRGVILEQIAQDIDATINVDFNFPDRGTKGDILSRVVGPARSWDRVEWSFSELEDPEVDTIALIVCAITADAQDTLISTLITDTSFDLSTIDAAQYPYLKLNLQSADASDMRSTPQLDFWRVYFEGQPEFVFNPTVGFEFERDSLHFGAQMRLETVVENVSKYPSESFDIKYAIVDQENQSFEATDVIPALEPGGMATVDFSKQMIESTGAHTLIVELNASQAQIEQHHFNNFGVQPFFVIRDDRNPLLDVTFDGRHIEDGDLVATQPVIEIALTDDNAFIPLDDPEDFELYLKTPGSFDFDQIPLDQPEVQFFPADLGGGQNRARVLWLPTFVDEGFYTFRALARDAAGNVSGNTFYEVRFEVYRKEVIANLTVAPNPTDGEVRFSFTLSGDGEPASFSLRIADVMGHVVREYTEEDLNLYVGTHTSDIVWDGRTQSGTRVPRGIYIYEIAVKSDRGFYRVSGLDPLTGKIVMIAR